MKPTDASEFETWMNSVWADLCIPHPSGGVTLYASPDYDKWHNALTSAELKFKAKYIHKSVHIPDSNSHWLLYQFPDGSLSAISPDGSGCTEWEDQ
jgi:hypothetical protein